MKKLALVLLGVTLSLVVASVVKAGTKSLGQVNISPGNYAYGSLGDARASSDGNQYLGCTVYGAAGPYYYTSCYARNAAGTTISCTTNDPTMAQIATGISSASAITFYVSGTSCTAILVGNMSYDSPMVP